jgi:uncharacterized protein (DUF1330 family)
MVAYWIGALDADDMESLKDYSVRAREALAKYGGRPLSRLGRFQLMEGRFDCDKIALVEFDTMEQAVACYNSPEYQDAIEHRKGKAEAVFFIVEGTDR